MRDRLEQRLAELRNELAAGQKMSNEFDARRADLQATMLRISGAIQVMEEMLQAVPTAERDAEAAPPRPAAAQPGNGTAVSPG